MKKLFLITIILILQSFPSFGEINNKGLICKYLEGNGFIVEIPSLHMKVDKNGNKFPSEVGYFLNENNVIPHFFQRRNDDIELIEVTSPIDSFTTTNKTIEWGNIQLRHILNRQTLLLKLINKTKVVSKYKCEVVEGEKVFTKKMKKIRDLYRSELKETFKKLNNKI